MSARSSKKAAKKNRIFGNLFGRSKKSPKSANHSGRNLSLEGLEKREMFAVTSLGFSGSNLIVRTDNASTSVNVSQVGSNIRITDATTNRSWDYAASSVGTVEFQGGAGNDRFVNYVSNLAVRGFGNAGNDYLEGYNGADVFVGGDGNDELVGYGGNDQMWGGNGDDILRGMIGDDQMSGEAGNDYIDGGAGNDTAWGADGNDILLGGIGNDQLVGGNGDDRLNGQAGVDNVWGEAGNDVLISIDAALGDYVDSGIGADIMWVDRIGTSRDNVYGAASTDIVQEVTSFANGADRTLDGDNLVDPSDSGNKLRYSNTVSMGNTQGSNPLFASYGPSMNDVSQGSVGDCWLLAGLSAIGMDSPHALRQNVFDFDDGTYGVRLGNNFYRVDNEMPVWNTASGTTASNLRYASTGAQNSMWVAVVEKAFAHYRRGQNTYASLDGGWSVEVNRAFRSTSAGEKTIGSYTSAAALANDLVSKWLNYQAVTIGFVGNLVGSVPLIANHMYTVASYSRDAYGNVSSITLRNPHGTRTSSFTTYVTLTAAQLFAQTGSVNWGRV
jgi:calpain family cysteine protease/hemolysin type calcium-binding protein